MSNEISLEKPGFLLKGVSIERILEDPGRQLKDGNERTLENPGLRFVNPLSMLKESYRTLAAG
jgi:hypothetical protein